MFSIFFFCYLIIPTFEYCLGTLDNNLFPQATYEVPIKSTDDLDTINFQNHSSCEVGDMILILRSSNIPEGETFQNVVAIFPWQVKYWTNVSSCEDFPDPKLEVYVKQGSVPTPTDYDSFDKGLKWSSWGGISVESKANEGPFYVRIQATPKNIDIGCSSQIWVSGFYFTGGIIAYCVGLGLASLLLVCCLCICSPCIICFVLILVIIVNVFVLAIVFSLPISVVCLVIVVVLIFIACCLGILALVGCFATGGSGGGDQYEFGPQPIEGEPLLHKSSSINDDATRRVSSPHVFSPGLVVVNEGGSNTVCIGVCVIICTIFSSLPTWPFSIVVMLVAWFLVRRKSGEWWVFGGVVFSVFGLIPVVQWLILFCGVVGAIMLMCHD